MSIAVQDDLQEILDKVRLWPPPMRVSLASKILQSLEGEQERPRESLKDLVGVLATGQTPPTDEEVDRILEEELMKKYGQ